MDNRNSALPPLDYLLAMVPPQIAEAFKGASKILNISESAVSRKVKLLELPMIKPFSNAANDLLPSRIRGKSFTRILLLF